MANNIQLLIDLGVDNTNSRNNINDYIDNLKNLHNVKVQLDVDGFSTADKSFADLQKQVVQLQRQLDSLNTTASKFDDSLDTRKITSGLEDVERKIKSTSDAVSKSSLTNLDKEFISSLKSLDEVYDYLNSKQIKFKIDENSKNEVTRITAQLQNELGQLETVNIKPKFFEGTDVLSNLNVTSSLSDANTFKLTESLTASVNKLKELEAQGLITGNTLDDFGKRLANASTNSEIDKITNDFNKLAREISDLDTRTIALQKFNAELEKLSRQGLIDNSQKQEFIDEANIVKSTKELQILQGALQSVAKETGFAKTINNAVSNVEPTIERLNTRLELALNKLGSNVDTSGLDTVRAKIDQLNNVNITSLDDISKFNTDIASVEKSITQLTTVGNNTARFEEAFNKANQAISDLERTGYATQSTIENFKKSLSDIPTGDLNKVKNLISEIKDESRNISIGRGLEQTFSSVEQTLSRLDSQLEKTKRQYAGTFDPTDLNVSKLAIREVSDRLAELRNNANFDINLITQKDIDTLKRGLDAANSSVKQFNANATLAGRNAVGLFQALQTAFTKFPIWLVASSAFFGVIRGVQDLTSKVIELDTAMTNLIRVADADNFEFTEVIDRAIVSTTELSGNLGEFLELVTEFARTGKTIDESFDLAETTQALVNISDLDAGQAVDSLTAAMISFNIAAEDSVRIADKLNEVNIIISLLLW